MGLIVSLIFHAPGACRQVFLEIQMMNRVVAVSLAALFCVSCVTLAQEALGATLKLTVNDEQGKPVAFRATVYSGHKEVGMIWERGKGEIPELPAAKCIVIVSHGFDYDAARLDLDMSRDVEKTVTLTKRYDIKSLGWYCGESHMHGQHGRNDKAQTFKDAERLAEANGLNYIQIAQWWTPDFKWTPLETLRQMAKEATTPEVAVNWNIESPKCYMTADDGGKAGNLHCYGHGCTLNLTDRPYDHDFWATSLDNHPNVRIIQEIHRQGAIVTLAHPARFWINPANGNFTSNWASELPFDYVTGNGYDGVDVFNDGAPVFFQHERVWWNLLNMGYKVAATANTDGSIRNGVAGKYRTYTKIDGEFSWAKIAGGIRDCATVASSGPMILLDVDGKGPGAEFVADGKTRKASIQAWSSPLPGEYIAAVQVIRNGEVMQSLDLRNQKRRDWKGELEIGGDAGFAWYAIRVTSNSTDPETQINWAPSDVYEVAMTSAVSFLPKNFKRPQPAQANVTLNVTDESGKPVAAKVSIIDIGKEIPAATVGESGTASLTVPASAILVIKAPGYAEVKKEIYKDAKDPEGETCFTFCRAFTGFYTPEAFHSMRTMLDHLTVDVKLVKASNYK